MSAAIVNFPGAPVLIRRGDIVSLPTWDGPVLVRVLRIHNGNVIYKVRGFGLFGWPVSDGVQLVRRAPERTKKSRDANPEGCS